MMTKTFNILMQYSRTRDKKIPLEKGSFFFCLVPRVAIWHSLFVLLFEYFSNYDVTTQHATFPATSQGCGDVKENVIGIFLYKMHI